MHLLDAARTRFKCIPVVHEVAAGIAAEYFNETNTEGKKAFALVTAGPGLTNIVTAIAGAFLESRDLLVIGGQVKTIDLKTGQLRQRGIQELDGRSIVAPITTSSVAFSEMLDFSQVQDFLHRSQKPGPVFLEIPLDIQGANAEHLGATYALSTNIPRQSKIDYHDVLELIEQLKQSERPVLLIGGGLSRASIRKYVKLIESLNIPIMTTWNGMDRYGANLRNYWGRPNTWGQRSSNILIQQSDLIVAIGTRLGLQQTGFAWQKFAPLAKIYQIEIDSAELNKGHPKIFKGFLTDANLFLEEFLKLYENPTDAYREWLVFGEKVIEALPLSDTSNTYNPEYLNPYDFIETMSKLLDEKDVVVPCSSGGAFTVTMQAFHQKFGQIMVTNKGLASMGYGLSGALGACESTQRRTILIEGDGGLCQNLQELGTLSQQKLNIKVFVFSNSGYASIRMNQRSYFGGVHLGCDIETGLGLPDWSHISKAYAIDYFNLSRSSNLEPEIRSILERNGPALIEVMIDPEQTYFPKINSRVRGDGQMESNPLHVMSPDLSEEQSLRLVPFLHSQVPNN